MFLPIVSSNFQSKRILTSEYTYYPSLADSQASADGKICLSTTYISLVTIHFCRQSSAFPQRAPQLKQVATLNSVNPTGS